MPTSCSLLRPRIRGNIRIPDVVHFFNCKISVLAVTYFAGLDRPIRRLPGVNLHVTERMVGIVTAGACVSGGLHPGPIDALAGLALLPNSALCRVRAAWGAVHRLNGICVALGAIPDILWEQYLREIHNIVLETDVGELARKDDVVALGVSLEQARKMDLVHQDRELDGNVGRRVASNGAGWRGAQAGLPTSGEARAIGVNRTRPT